jgi:hypothetical protein
MKEIDALLGFSLRELAGADVTGNIPVTDALANSLIAQRLATRDVAVSQMRLNALDGDAFDAEVVIKGGLVPVVHVHMQIEQQPRPDHPVLVLGWSLPSLGPLALLAGSFVSKLKNLPAGVRVEGKQVFIDIRALCSANGQAELLDHLTGLEVHTRQGAFLVHVELRVPTPSRAPRDE